MQYIRESVENICHLIFRSGEITKIISNFATMKSRRNKETSADVRLSKNLSYILRHGAEKLNLPITSGGCIKLCDLLALQDFRGVSEADVKRIVENNDKQRFSLDTIDGELMIRANQGHTISSIHDDQLLKRIHSAPLCVHGTYMRNWDSIYTNGLKRMSRNHIHFACDETNSNQVISGMRSNVEIKIYIDFDLAIKDGIPFYISKNNVILSPGVGEQGTISHQYFQKVVRTADNEILFSN